MGQHRHAQTGGDERSGFGQQRFARNQAQRGARGIVGGQRARNPGRRGSRRSTGLAALPALATQPRTVPSVRLK